MTSSRIWPLIVDVKLEQRPEKTKIIQSKHTGIDAKVGEYVPRFRSSADDHGNLNIDYHVGAANAFNVE
jgi:hypothetical protein